MAKSRFLGVLVGCAMVLVACAPAIPVAADTGRPAGQNLTVDSPYTVSGSETWDLVFVKTDGTLSVPSGALLNVKSIFLQGGSLRVNGGTVTVVQTVLGVDAVVMGDCSEFNLSGGATLTLNAPDASSTIDTSQGGEAIVQINASASVVVTGGSRIQCTGGAGFTRGTPWTTSALSGYVSAGGRGLISLGGPATPYVEVSGGAQLVTAGSYGGRAADGRPGSGANGGTGGGYSNGGAVSGFVGSGGDGRVELFGLNAVLNNAVVTCTGGRGGDAGNGGAGSTTGTGNTNYPYYMYCGGGGGGGYGGGNGGSDYQTSGKGGTATDNVGTGGYAVLNFNAQNVTIRKATVTLKGGDGGYPGNGGTGGYNPTYSGPYSPGGGGGGFGGGGGASTYATGSSGSASGNVGAGGEANLSITCQNLTIDGLTLYGTGGGSQTGGTGGNGYGGGGGGGGYGGGGGGGYYNGGGNGQVVGNVGSGGNATMVVSTENINAVNTTVDLDGGKASDGGKGGNGGSYGGGGGGGYGGGGGAGAYNYNSAAGSGTCGQNVGRGGMTLFRLAAAGRLWLNSSKVNLTGGASGNAGAGGSGSGGGGGGGGYSGSGGAGSSGQAGEGTVNNWVGDGGDAQLEIYCARGSIPAPPTVQLDARGGLKGDGLTKKGSGTGGAGKGRSPTYNGATPKNIPRLLPITLGPADGTLYNNMDPRLTWMRCIDGTIFPNTADPVWNYEVQISNDSQFGVLDDYGKDIDPDESAYTPSGLRGGKYYWRVRALYDGDKSPGWSEVHNFLKNGPPTQLKNIPPVSFPEDTNLMHGLDLSLYFTDDLYPNDLTYAVSYEQDPFNLHAVLVDGHWVDFYTMTPEFSGKREFKVRVTDKGGISMESNNFTVTVTSVNDPPFFLPVPVINVTEDQTATVDLTEYIGDPDTQLNQLRLGLLSTFVTVEGPVLTFNYPREVGTDHINLSLTDGQWTVYIMLEVKVKPVNDRPVTLPMPDLTTNEDAKLVLDLTPFAMDEEDAPAQLVWRAENIPFDLLNISIDNKNVMTIAPLPDLNGEARFLLVARDRAGAEAMTNLSVKVLPVNDPPLVKGIPNILVRVTVPYKLDVRQYVTDVDSDVATQVRLTTNSMYASVSGFQITFNYPNDESLESEVVRITASDGRASGHQDITVTMTFPPSFTEPIGAQSVEATREVVVDLSRHVNDREDGPGMLKWTATRVDKTLISVSFDGNGTMKIRSAGEKTGTTEFLLTVTDSDGNKVNQSVQVTVTPKRSAFGDVAGNDLLLWGLPIALVAAIVGGSATFYMLASRRKRRLEEEQAAAAQQMLPTQEQRMVSLGPASSGAQTVPEGKVCFACGSRLVVAGPGSFQCTKCGRTQK